MTDIRLMEHVPGKSINLAMSIRARTALKEVGLEDAIIRDHGLPMEARMIHRTDGTTYSIPYGKKGQVSSIHATFFPPLKYIEPISAVYLLGGKTFCQRSSAQR